MIQEFDATDGYTTTTVTLDAGIKFVRPVGSYTFAIDPDSSTYWVSPDKGDTWVSRAPFGTRKLQDIARLASGRWIGFVADGASSRFVYSDDANEPLTWHDSTIDPTATMHIASNGQVACGVSWSGGIRRTEDGLTWDFVAVSRDQRHRDQHGRRRDRRRLPADVRRRHRWLPGPQRRWWADLGHAGFRTDQAAGNGRRHHRAVVRSTVKRSYGGALQRGPRGDMERRRHAVHDQQR
jgi:hypothetical protein